MPRSVATTVWNEYRAGAGAGEQAVEVDLAALERGEKLPDPHAKVGPHWAVYPGTVFEYETTKKDQRMTDSSTLNYAYVPVISKDHAFFKAWAALIEEHGEDDDAWPEEAAKPELRDFVMLVKTKEFATVGDIPDDWASKDGVTGLVINRIEELSSEEKKMFQESFADLDFDKILLLEEGRAPTSSGTAIALLVACVIGVLIGGGMALAGFAFKRS